MTTNQLKYYDFYVGDLLKQAPTAWDVYRVKLAASSYRHAVEIFKSLGFPSNVCRVEQYYIRSRNGTTVVQYKMLGFRDYHELLESRD